MAPKILPVALFVLLLAVSLGFAQTRTGGKGGSSPSGSKSVGKTAKGKSPREAIDRAMDQRLTLTKGEMTLADFVELLSTQQSVPVLLDQRALADMGVAPDAKIKVDSPKATLEETLDSCLKPIHLTWTVGNGALLVTSQATAESTLETAVYKLLRPMNPDALQRDIASKVEPTSWDNKGGPGSMAFWPGGAVVIAQTLAAHRQIARQYSTVLRRVYPAPPAAKSRAGLAAKVNCKYVETPLEQVVADLGKQSGLAVSIDAKTLANNGIKADTPITCSLQGVSLESALGSLLRPLSLAWVPEKSGVKITTPEAAAKNLQTETYDVRDLLLATRGSSDPLVELITSTVDPTTWSQVGGLGTVSLGPGGLQVRGTYGTQRQIEELLAGLRLAQSTR
jgi:hypothetical protein